MTKTEKERRELIKKQGAKGYQRMVWMLALENRRKKKKAQKRGIYGSYIIYDNRFCIYCCEIFT